MSVKSKIFWSAFAAELIIAGVIGWKVANAKRHPWEVGLPPKRRRQNPLPPSPLVARGQRQRQGATHYSQANALAGEIATETDS